MKGSFLKYVASPSEVARQCRRAWLAGKSSAVDLRTLVWTRMGVEVMMIVSEGGWLVVGVVDRVKRDQAGNWRLVQRTSKKGKGKGEEEV